MVTHMCSSMCLQVMGAEAEKWGRKRGALKIGFLWRSHLWILVFPLYQCLSVSEWLSECQTCCWLTRILSLQGRLFLLHLLLLWTNTHSNYKRTFLVQHISGWLIDSAQARFHQSLSGRFAFQWLFRFDGMTIRSLIVLIRQSCNVFVFLPQITQIENIPCKLYCK